MKVDCVQPQVDLDFIKSCKRSDAAPVLYMNVVGSQWQTQRFRMPHQFRTQLVIANRLGYICLQPALNVMLELVVSVVNGREEADIGEKTQENRESRNCPPAGELMREFVQNSRSDSLPANNSSHISPCSVHSGVTDPEIWTSSTFNVP